MNILLTSVGRRTYLIRYFQKALAGKGKVFSSNSIMTYAMSQADECVITPQIYDSSYIGFLLEYCQKNEISVIIPLFDIDLPILSQNVSVFENIGVKLVVSSYEATKVCNDKWNTYLFLKEIGLNIIPTFLSIEETKMALLQKEITYPLIIKPRWGMGSIGIYEAENLEELIFFYNKLSREIFSTYLRFESIQNKKESIIIQQKIRGVEFGLDIINDLEANYVTTVAKQKIAMRAGETDIAQIVDREPFESVACLISKKLKHIANLDLDCFVTKENKIYILEMNCRFGGQYPFSHLAGVNLPLQIIKWLENQGTQQNLLTPKIGVKGCKDLVPCVIEFKRNGRNNI